MIAILVIPALSMAQNKVIKKFYDKYKGYENVTDIKLQGWVLKLAATFSDEEEAEKLLKKITHLRVLVMDEGNLVSKNEYSRLIKDVKQNAFEELIKIKEDDQNIEFMIREEKETITDVLILVNSPEDFILLSLEGNLKFSDLQNLNIDIDGGEHFQKLPAKKKDIPKA